MIMGLTRDMPLLEACLWTIYLGERCYMQLPDAPQLPTCRGFPRPIMTVLQRQRGNVAKVTCLIRHSEIPGCIGTEIMSSARGKHVFQQASKSAPSGLGSRRHAMFTGQMITGGEYHIEHLPLFYLDSNLTGL